MDNPLFRIKGAALRMGSLWLLDVQYAAHLAQSADEAIINDLVDLLDEIRSYCHDEYGIDCLIQEDDAEGPPCPTCGNPCGCGASPDA